MRAHLPALVLVVATVLGGCSTDRRSPGPESLAEVDVAPVATVEVDRSGFDPAVLTVEAGQTFEVRNVGAEEHSLRLEEPFLDTGDLLPGETTRVALRTEGTHVGVDGHDRGHRIEIRVTG